MRLATLSLFLFLAAMNISFAQQVSSKRYKAALVGKTALNEVPDKYNTHIYRLDIPEPEEGADKKKLQEAKRLIKQKFPRKRTANPGANGRTTSVPAPIIAIQFETDTTGGIPPDNYLAVSKGNKLVTVMNDAITIFNPLNDSFIQQKYLEGFSYASGLDNGTVDYRYDPKVVYDPVADRFICIMLNSTDQYNYIILGFTQTNDPTGTWAFYTFKGDYTNDSTWFDYPAIAITQNEVFFTGNKIIYNDSWQAGFTRSLIYQVNKADGYAADSTINYRIWDSVTYDGAFLRCLYPLNPSDSILGPSEYFLSNKDFDTLNDTVFLVKIPDTIGSIDSTMTITALASSLSYGVPPDALQPDTTLTLATNDNRVLGGYINGNEIQFVCTSVDPLDGASAIYHGIISNFTTSPVVTGNIFSIDTLDFGYPNISYTGYTGSGFNQSIISFEYSGATTYPGYGAIFFDGTGYSPMTNIHSGDSTINQLGPGVQRWGDYSGSQPNWNAIGTVWVEGLYGNIHQEYEDYFAELISPYLAVPQIAKTNNNSILYPNPSREMVSFEFTIEKEQQYSFMIYDIQGRIVDKLTDKICETGKNVIKFNIAPLSPGTYFLKAIGNDGSAIMVHSFVRN